jgi:hypothetical protein
MKHTLFKHARLEGDVLKLHPLGEGSVVEIPLTAITAAKFPFVGEVIIWTGHTKHDLDVSNFDVGEVDSLRAKIEEAVRKHKAADRAAHPAASNGQRP